MTNRANCDIINIPCKEGYRKENREVAIVKSKNKKTGITYVYESESYWDPEKKQPRNRRKLIGRLDENGGIVPTGARGRKKSKDSQQVDRDRVVADLDDAVSYYQEQCRESEKQNALLRDQIRKLEKDKAEILAVLQGVLDKHHIQ